jgi:hypothetical protein
VIHLIEQNLVHVAALFTLICFLFRDQIRLRAFAAIGDALLALYYYVAFADPLWAPLGWCVLNVVINVTMIGVILRDGRIFSMSDRDMTLFQKLDGLTPGQFRTLAKLGEWRQPAENMLLTNEGEKPNELYFVLDGKVTILKANRSFEVDPGLFIGELAFLRKKPATATVKLGAGSDYIAWEASRLETLFAKSDEIKNAMTAILSRDMAEKVAKT